MDFNLDDMQIASPCTASWDEMAGDDQVRYCGECRMNVYNLSGMSRQEAEELVKSHEGRLCVRFYRRKDGTILTRDCPKGVTVLYRRRVRGLFKQGIAAAAVVTLAGAFILRADAAELEKCSVKKDVNPEQIVRPPVEPLMGLLIPPALMKDFWGTEPKQLDNLEENPEDKPRGHQSIPTKEDE